MASGGSKVSTASVKRGKLTSPKIKEISDDLSDYLDDDGADYKTQANNHSKDEEERVIPLSGEQSFREKLLEQIQLLPLINNQYVIADTLIGNLDESGYLNREIEALVDDPGSK